MMQWVKMLLFAFAAIFAGAVVSAIPPFPGWFEMVDANQTSWLIATGGALLYAVVRLTRGFW